MTVEAEDGRKTDTCNHKKVVEGSRERYQVLLLNHLASR